MDDLNATGAYEIRNRINGKVYVGSTAVSFRTRWRKHREALRNKRHHTRHLQSAWNKHGESAFEFRILEIVNPGYVVAVEQTFLDWKKPYNRDFGYNSSPSSCGNIGFSHTKETREKIATANRGKVRSAETRAKISKAKFGRVLSEEHRTKIGVASKKNMTAEARKNLSIANTGRILSAEAREKISASKRGKTRSDETRAKIGLAGRGRTASIETRAKMSAKSRGRKHTEESRLKIAAVVKAWHARRRVDRRLTNFLRERV